MIALFCLGNLLDMMPNGSDIAPNGSDVMPNDSDNVWTHTDTFRTHTELLEGTPRFVIIKPSKGIIHPPFYFVPAHVG